MFFEFLFKAQGINIGNVMYLLPIQKVKFQILIFPLSNLITPPFLLRSFLRHTASQIFDLPLQVQLCAAVEGMEVEDGEKRRAIARKDGGGWE